MFAYFESTDSKSRQNFLEVLRGAHTDYTINDFAVAYWQRQKLAQAVIERLTAGAAWFADKAAWQRLPGLAGRDRTIGMSESRPKGHCWGV